MDKTKTLDFYIMEKTCPLVSILVPVYGVEKYIERCAISLFEQTYEDLEYIFVDDCSLDNSIQILKDVLVRYPQRTNQVKIIRHSHNRGISAVRNTLVEHASGDFVSFVDSDDWVERNSVDLLIRRQQETDADIITARAYFHLSDRTVEYPDGGWQVDKDTALKQLLRQGLSHSLWRRLIRTSIFRENCIMLREGVNMDEDFHMIVHLFYYASKVDGIDAFIYHYNRDNRDSYMTKYRDNYQLQNQRLESVHGIIHFFKDRDQECYNISYEYLVKCLYAILGIAADRKDKERFTSISKELNSYRKYWGGIKWNYLPLRLVERNYYLNLLSSPFVNLARRLYHIVKRG